jgi:hypothetical protein
VRSSHRVLPGPLISSGNVASNPLRIVGDKSHAALAGQGPASKPMFAPIPIRAIGDKRLSARHLRVLAAVAAHDRLGKNGMGCCASHKRLAEMAGCNYTRQSATLSDLNIFGYVTAGKHPLNGRLRVYRVVYNAADGEAMLRSNDSLPRGKQSSLGPKGPIVHNFDETVCLESPEASDFICKTGTNIFEEIKNNTPVTGSELRPTQGLAGLDVNEARSYISDVEAALNSGDTIVRGDEEQLRQIAMDIGLPDNLRQSATRLMVKVELLIDQIG